MQIAVVNIHDTLHGKRSAIAFCSLNLSFWLSDFVTCCASEVALAFKVKLNREKASEGGHIHLNTYIYAN